MSDLISRQEAIDAILQNKEVYSKNFGDDPIDKYTIAIIENDAQTIAQLPSAERKGRWIIYTVSPWDGEDVKCSVCGEKGCAPYWDYCPNCGSQMVDVVNEDDD